MTAGAKRYYFAEAHLPAEMRTGLVHDAVGGLLSQLGILSLGWALLLLFGGRLLAGVFIAFAATFFVAYWQELPGALHWYDHRYLYPLLPWLLAGFAAALGSRRQYLASLRLVRTAVPYILAIGLTATLADAPGLWAKHMTIRGETRDHLAGVANWCNKHLPPNSTLLIHDAGYIAYGTRFKAVDLVGLKTLWAVPYHRDLTFPSNGLRRGEAIDRIARRARPDYLLVLCRLGADFPYRVRITPAWLALDELTTDPPFNFRVFRITSASVASYTDSDLSAPSLAKTSRKLDSRTGVVRDGIMVGQNKNHNPGLDGLRRGDAVTVRSLDEILATLDGDAKFEGLPFMPEMIPFCGKTFRVYRRAEKTCVEGFGMRSMSDAVFLEGLRCDGSAHGGCQRGCLFFWKKAWLKPEGGRRRAERRNGTNRNPFLRPPPSALRPPSQLPTTKGDRFYCQSTELAAATSDYPPGKLRHYLHDLRVGEMTLRRFAFMLWMALTNRVWRLLHGRRFYQITGQQKKTLSAELNLQPGELVEVKSCGGDRGHPRRPGTEPGVAVRAGDGPALRPPLPGGHARPHHHRRGEREDGATEQYGDSRRPRLPGHLLPQLPPRQSLLLARDLAEAGVTPLEVPGHFRNTGGDRLRNRKRRILHVHYPLSTTHYSPCPSTIKSRSIGTNTPFPARNGRSATATPAAWSGSPA